MTTMTAHGIDWRRRLATAALMCAFGLGAMAHPLAQAPREQVRVPKRSANIHAGPSSTTIVLLNVPQNTVLPVIERRGPWVVVELSPKLRETATPMRWFRNEKQGFMHDSTVEPVKPPTR
jgi:hypothetical protein